MPLIQFQIQEASMEPLLFSKDKVLVNRLSKGKRGAIIVLKNPQKSSLQKYLIKQVIKEENNQVYVVGVNKTKSIDSRHFGWIDKKDIVGKMIAKM